MFFILNYTVIENTGQKTQGKKSSFVKESVENADLYKSVLNKIMTTHE